MTRSSILLLTLVVVACNGGGDSSASGTETSSGTGETTDTGTDTSTGTGSSTGGGPTTTTAPTTTSPGTTDVTTGTTGDPDTTTTAPGTSTTDGTTGGPGDPVYDPNEDGPWQYDELSAEIMVGQANVPVTAYYPTSGPEEGPYPVVTIAHGFNLPPTQYTKYATRLASHGYVALNVDHRGYIGEPVNHFDNAKQVLAALDWAAGHPTLMSIADVNNVGTTGHSLGGKISVLGAMIDARVKASITLDPVDGATMCPNMMACPDVSAMLPIAIPLGFLGETLDTAGFMACAPAADNFTTFYAAADSPALQVTVNGANHMSFIDDVASCGFTCNFCQMPMLDNATVNDLSRAYVVAYYGRYLRDNPGYDTYLTGAEAKTRYVDMGLVTIEEK